MLFYELKKTEINEDTNKEIRQECKSVFGNCLAFLNIVYCCFIKSAAALF